MNITKPKRGQSFSTSTNVQFEGAAGETVATIRLVADGQFPLGEVEPENGKWSLSHRFSSIGTRKIQAIALDEDGIELGKAAISIVIKASDLNGYEPPAASVGRLGGIVDKLSSARRIHHAFKKGGKAIFELESGAIFYESLLDLDSDGSRFAATDATGQSATSLRGPGGKPVDADAVPYFVLPGSGFYQELDIHLGDVAAILHRDKVEYAVFADNGPKTKLGEGSIALHRSLGHETIRNGKFHDEAIDEGVITIVFPGSGNGTPQTPDRIREIGRKLFSELGGVA